MGCFSLWWFAQILIFAVVVAAIVAILKILVPYVISKLNVGPEASEGIAVVTAVFRVAIWAVIIIFVIYVCFALISCLLSYSGGMPLLPRR